MATAPAQVAAANPKAKDTRHENGTGLMGFASFLDAVGLPAWIYDPRDLKILDANQAATALYGFPRSTFRTMSVLDVRPASERERFLAATRDSTEDGRMNVWRHRKANGVEFDVITSRRTMRWNGQDVCLVVVIDWTEMARLQRSLEDTRFLLDAIIDALPTGVFVKDMEQNGRYTIYNTTVGKTVGREPGEVIGRTDAEAFEGVDADTFIAQDRDVMSSGRQLVIEREPVTRPNGEVRLIRTVKKPLMPASGGKPRYLLGISEDVTERAENEARIAHMAHHDFLTDLPNRLLFGKTLSQALRQGPAHGPLALLSLDLDGFKLVNDTYGHQAGDTLLQAVAGRLSACCHSALMVGRLGGDEFAVLAQMDDDTAALALAGRISASLSMPFDLGACVVEVGTCVGIAFAPDGTVHEDLLMRHADAALYVAKAERSGAIRIYDPSMTGIIEQRLTLSDDLRRALREAQFAIEYQPQFDAGDDRLAGFEALLRWHHPVRGTISPADFIPVAERTGLIGPIGDWVLRQACREAVRWPPGLTVAVNLSAVQFTQRSNLVASVKAALRETGLAPERLELEITESVMLASSGANLATLHRLRGLGVRIAMDDFGTGYSSLSYLRSFPFDKIKLDRSFVSDLCENPGSLAIVRAVTGLGAALDITTTAEGVETVEQLNILKTEGFRSLQGFLIGRPMTAEAAMILASARP